MKKSALKNHNENVASSYLVFDKEDKLINFYSLQTIMLDTLDKNAIFNCRHSINIQYIATIKEKQRNGIGTDIMTFILKEAAEISKKIGIRFLSLYSKDDRKNWYKKFGFKEIHGHQFNLMYFDFNIDGGE